MTEEDSIFDIDSSIKKKKKKKKTPFDIGSLEESENQMDETSTDTKKKDDAQDDEDTSMNVDLDDFSNLKKKKKKKKPFNLEDLDTVAPEIETKEESTVFIAEERDGEDMIGKDDDLDFTLPKKKKKKKKINIDDLDGEFAIGDDDEEDDSKFEDDLDSKITTCTSSTVSWLNEDRDYTYDELLMRVFNIMREKNPDMIAGEKRRFVMRPPQVLRVGTKKTSFANFIEICKMVHRQPKHLQAFLLAELGTSGSVDANSQLLIKGRFQQKQIENVLRRYIKEYVTCHTCRSPDTILQKDTRLFFLQCETCGSRCSVASIKSGFQAVTGKRAAIRAKTA